MNEITETKVEFILEKDRDGRRSMTVRVILSNDGVLRNALRERECDLSVDDDAFEVASKRHLTDWYIGKIAQIDKDTLWQRLDWTPLNRCNEGLADKLTDGFKKFWIEHYGDPGFFITKDDNDKYWAQCGMCWAGWMARGDSLDATDAKRHNEKS